MDANSNAPFFRGLIRQPDGDGERVVVRKAARALALRMATKEAEKLNWDWVVMHCRPSGDDPEKDGSFEVIEQWSSVAGHESFL